MAIEIGEACEQLTEKMRRQGYPLIRIYHSSGAIYVRCPIEIGYSEYEGFPVFRDDDYNWLPGQEYILILKPREGPVVPIDWDGVCQRLRMVIEGEGLTLIGHLSQDAFAARMRGTYGE